MALEALDRLLAPQLDELQRNPRLRYGLWTIATIVLVYCILVTGDAVSSAREERRQALERLAEVEALAAEREAWQERVIQARAFRVELERQLWRAETPGLAQASLQSWLQGAARRAGIDEPQIVMREVDELTAGEQLWLVAANVNASFQPSALGLLLQEIEGATPRLNVESMTLRNDRNRSVRMVVSGLFIPAGVGGSAE